MRVLTSDIPGTGHLLPLLPTLHALRDAGDTVLVASAEPLRAEVEAAGLDFAAVVPPWHESDADALLPGCRSSASTSRQRPRPTTAGRSSTWSMTRSSMWPALRTTTSS